MSRRNPRGSSAARRRELARRRVLPRGTSFWDASTKLNEELTPYWTPEVIEQAVQRLERDGLVQKLVFDEASQSLLPVLRGIIR